MFKTIKGIVLGLRIAPLWIKALDLAAKGENEESKKTLIRMEKIGLFSDVEYCLLRGYVEYKLSCTKNSLMYLHKAIDRLPKIRRCNDDERQYLKAYAQWLMNLQEVSHIKHLDIDFDSINLRNITKPFLENYPLRIHPKWID